MEEAKHHGQGEASVKQQPMKVPVNGQELVGDLIPENKNHKIDMEEAKHHWQGEASVKQQPMKVPVNGQELDGDLIVENKNLKALVNSLEKKIDASEKRYEERNKQALEAEMQVVQLKTSVQRLEQKLADVESAGKITPHSTSARLTKQPSESVHKGVLSAISSKRSASIIERQREQADTLFKCVPQNLGFSNGKPVASFTIYKCFIHWNSFEAEKTNVFDRLIQIIGSAIEDKARNDLMAYWLSTTSALLFLLQHTLRTEENPPPQQKSFFGRMFKPSQSSANLPIGGFTGVKQVEGKFPALLFKQQLTAYVENIYGIIRENVKNDLSSLISSCIQAPKNSTMSLERLNSSNSPTTHWKGIINCLDGHLSILKENHVPEILVQKIFTQIFSYINEQLLNSLLLHKDFCTFSSGQHIKSALDELESWCNQHQISSWEELKHVRQTVGFLVIGKKSAITYDDIANDLCPMLKIQQQYRICSLYWDDDNNTSSVNPEILSSMEVDMTEDFNEEDTSSFLLDDNSSFPISVDDFSGSLYEMDFTGVKPFSELAENPEFSFLLE